jgi:hypothetical protein
MPDTPTKLRKRAWIKNRIKKSLPFLQATSVPSAWDWHSPARPEDVIPNDLSEEELDSLLLQKISAKVGLSGQDPSPSLLDSLTQEQKVTDNIQNHENNSLIHVT